MGIINPWIFLGLLGAMLCAFVAGYFEGNKHANTQCIANQVVSQKAAETKVDAVNTAREDVASNRELSRGRIRSAYSSIEQAAHQLALDTPASAVVGAAGVCGLDDDGLRLWNSANGATAEAVRSEPDYALSTAPAAVEWLDTRHASKPYRVDGAIRTVPGSTGETGGVQP